MPERRRWGTPGRHRPLLLLHPFTLSLSLSLSSLSLFLSALCVINSALRSAALALAGREQECLLPSPGQGSLILVVGSRTGSLDKVTNHLLAQRRV